MLASALHQESTLPCRSVVPDSPNTSVAFKATVSVQSVGLISCGTNGNARPRSPRNASLGSSLARSAERGSASRTSGGRNLGSRRHSRSRALTRPSNRKRWLCCVATSGFLSVWRLGGRCRVLSRVDFAAWLLLHMLLAVVWTFALLQALCRSGLSRVGPSAEPARAPLGRPGSLRARAHLSSRTSLRQTSRVGSCRTSADESPSAFGLRG
mmetsp:Transcript_37243/g.106956  ORF Transcript_37243/g.106956 Transcript_37243/m.106956 type:complete len:211 (-) Transcript_37243:265-897(-)